jgi:glycerophosphoryl diester phosphodiesterase
MPATEPLLIAHRGASRDAPENTLAAFELAWQQGAAGIEADFRLTRDGRIVCLHDATTGRTGGTDLAVAETSFADLRRLDVGSWKGSTWRGERIPSLEEVLQRLPSGKMFMLELKCGAEIIAPLRTILRTAGVPYAQLRLLAFDVQLVTILKEQLAEVRVCLNVDYRWRLRRPSRQEIMTVMQRCRADGLSIRGTTMLDAQFVDELQEAGKEVFVWTVDSARSGCKYRDMGVDGIMTNRPGWLASRMKAAGPSGETT